MNKFILMASALFLSVFIMTSNTVTAQFNPIGESCQGEAADSEVCKSATEENPISGRRGAILRIANILSILGGVAAVVMIVVSGIKIILSGGDANRVKSGRETLIYAFIGLIVILLSRSLIVFIVNRT
jgi:hypothetical protein